MYIGKQASAVVAEESWSVGTSSQEMPSMPNRSAIVVSAAMRCAPVFLDVWLFSEYSSPLWIGAPGRHQRGPIHQRIQSGERSPHSQS
jgi:hypothetical protein